jgi:hypothetical protein
MNEAMKIDFVAKSLRILRYPTVISGSELGQVENSGGCNIFEC